MPKYVIVEGVNSGVYSGDLFSESGQEIVLQDSRELMSYPGTASLNELSLTGPAQPENSQFSAPVSEIKILDAIKLLYCTDTAKTAIKAVPDYVPV